MQRCYKSNNYCFFSELLKAWITVYTRLYLWDYTTLGSFTSEILHSIESLSRRMEDRYAEAGHQFASVHTDVGKQIDSVCADVAKH